MLSVALLSAFSSSAFAVNSGGIEFENKWNEDSYGNIDSLTNNTVTIDVGFSGNVYGAYTVKNNQVISGNKTVLALGVTVTGGVYGGYSDVKTDNGAAFAEASFNTVRISQAKVKDQSGYEFVYVDGGDANAEGESAATAYANNNTVIISGETSVDTAINGGYSSAVTENGEALTEASFNTVTISQGKINDSVTGGTAVAYSNSTATAYANNNTVTIFGESTVDDEVYGGYSSAVTENGAATAHSNYNTVAILDGATIHGDIYGGYTEVSPGVSNIGQASYNTVIIDSSSVTGAKIVGGAVNVDSSSESHSATHNTVKISGNYAINDDVSLWGGYNASEDAPSLDDDLFTGNTLNLDARHRTAVTTSVGKVGNFQTINLRAGNVQDGDSVLHTSGTTLGDAKGNGTTVNLLSVETDSLKANDQITLISNATGGLANDGQKQFVAIGESFVVGYNGLVNLVEGDTSENVVLEILGKGANPKTKVLSESRAAEMAFLNSASDLLQDQDIHKAGKHAFGAVRGIYNKYKTGSSVDISGIGLVTGVANTWAGDGSDVTGAVFVEAGWGSFDTMNNISGDELRGDGDSYYFGTGLIGKYDVTQGLLSGLYAEAAAHVGIISTDYSNADLTNAIGQKASYDNDSLYYAAHAKTGYRWNVTDSFDMDISATYLWNYLESQEVKIVQDKFDLDSVQSHRMRLAAEVGYTADKGFRPYAGVAWEREFDGEVGGSVAGYRLEEVDLSGNSGLAWAGVSFEPNETSPVKADAEITTYFGQRKGVSGRVWVRYEF